MYPRIAMFIRFDQKFVKWVLFLGLAFLYLYGSNILPLLGPDEPRYTQVGRQMFESGDWITSRLGEHPWFEKPVLLYWMMCVSFGIFGVNEFAARFPSAVSALLCVMILFQFLKNTVGEKRALLAAGIFGTSAFAVGFAHAATFDMLLTTCVTASLFYFFKYLVVERERKNLFLAYALCGLGILAKGFVAPAIIFLVGAIFWFFERKNKPKLNLIAGAAIVAVVAGIWLIPVSIIHGTRFWDDFFLQHHLQRYTTSKFHRSEGFLFYFPILALGMFPWTGAILCGFRSNRQEIEVKLARFCMIWFISSFSFFSVSQSKLPGYILPLAPAYSVLCAFSLADAWESNKRIRILVGLGVFQVSTALALLWGIAKFQVPHSPVYVMAGAILILFCISAWFLFVRKGTAAFIIQGLISISAILIAVHGIYPKTTWNETRRLVQQILPMLKDQKIAVSNVYDFSLVYYTNARVELDDRGYFIDLRNANDLAVYLSKREKGFVIASNDDLPWMRQASFLQILDVIQGPERSIIVLRRK